MTSCWRRTGLRNRWWPTTRSNTTSPSFRLRGTTPTGPESPRPISRRRGSPARLPTIRWTMSSREPGRTVLGPTYTDIHDARLKFFIGLLDPFPLAWEGAEQHRSDKLSAGQYRLVTG